MKIPQFLILLSFIIPLMAQSPDSPAASPHDVRTLKGPGFQTLREWQDNEPSEPVSPNEVIVIVPGLKAKTKSALFRSLEQNMGGTLLDTAQIGKNTYILMRLQSEKEVAVKGAARMKVPGLTVHRNTVHRPFSDDPLFHRQWALSNDGTFNEGGIQALAGADIEIGPAWDITMGSEDVIVAVIDTGIDYNHPDLAANMWRNPGEIPNNGLDDDGNGFVDDIVGYDFGGRFFQDPPDADPMDIQGHGTHVAGIIGAVANNGIGVAGVCPNVRLMAVKNFSDFGLAQDFNSIKAIAYATANGARVINASWGGFNYNEALKQAISDAGDEGVLFVAAAGNESTNIDFDLPNQVSYPAGYNLPNILAVASTNEDDTDSSFTNRGPERVHIAAPGNSILSTLPPIGPFFTLNSNNSKSSTQLELSGDLHINNTKTKNGTATRISGTTGYVLFPRIQLNRADRTILSIQYKGQMGRDARMALEMFDGRQWRPVARASGTRGMASGHYNLAIPSVMATQHFRFRISLTASKPANLDLMEVRVYKFLEPGDPAADYDQAYGLNSGTSMAAPHVTGVAALLLAQDPTATPNQLISRILGGAESLETLETITLTSARLNAFESLKAKDHSSITTPLAGKTFAQGQFAPFAWNLAGTGEQALNATLYNGDQPVSNTQKPIISQNGYVRWYTPNAPAGSNYRIKLSTTVGDLFSETFSIMEATPAIFPDPALKNALTNWFDKNRDGALTLKEVERYDDYLVLELPEVQSLEGIHQFDYAWGLGLGQMPKLTNLGQLPAYLLIYRSAFTGITELSNLPPYLLEFHHWASPLQSIDVLPDRITDLTISSTPLVQLPNIPENAIFLDLSYNRLTQLPSSNASFVSMNLSGNKMALPNLDGHPLSQLILDDMELETLPSLSSLTNLRNLSCTNNRLTQFPEIAANLQTLDISDNRLETLPRMPFQGAYVYATNNRLSSIESLDGLIALIANRNQLQSLPPMSNTISTLNVDDNLLTQLPTIPQFMFGLSARNNQLESLPDIPPYLYNLNVSGNRLTSLPEMQSSFLQELDVADNLLTTMPDMTGLTNLIFVHLSNNFLTDPPHILENSLFVAHMDGNYFDEGDCDEIQRLQDLDLQGFTFRLFYRNIGPQMDGLSINPQGDGSVVHCESPTQSEPVSHLEVFKLGQGRYQVSWQNGRLANRVIQDYRIEVYRDGQLESGQLTSNTWAILNLEDRESYEITVTPFNYPEIGPSSSIALRSHDFSSDEDDENAEDESRHASKRRVYQIPNFASGQNQWWEFSALNPGVKRIRVNIRAYDENGRMASRRPLLKNLAPGEQITINPTSLGVNLERVAWFQIKTSGPCSFLSLSGETKDAFAASVSDQVFRRGSFSLGTIFGNLNPQLKMINPNNRPANLSFTIYDHDGLELSTQTRRISARGMLQISGEDLAEINNANLVIWESDRPLSVTETGRTPYAPNDQFAMQQPGMGAVSGWLPFSGEIVHIQNSNPFEVSVKFQAYKANGKADISRTVSVPAFTSKFMDAYIVLFSSQSEPALEPGNALFFHAEAPVKISMEIRPAVLGANPVVSDFMSDMVPAVSNYETRFTIPGFRNDENWITQATVVNIIEGPAQATLIAYDRNGRELGRVERELAPFGRTVFDAKMLEKTDFAELEGDMAWVRISSDAPLTVQATWLGQNIATPYLAAQQIQPDEL